MEEIALIKDQFETEADIIQLYLYRITSFWMMLLVAEISSVAAA